MTTHRLQPSQRHRFQRRLRPAGRPVGLAAACLLAAHALGACGRADATQGERPVLPANAAYVRYARVLAVHGDSAIGFFHEYGDQTIDGAFRIAAEMRRKAGDLEAYTPPPDLQAIHGQLVRAARETAQIYDGLARTHVASHVECIRVDAVMGEGKCPERLRSITNSLRALTEAARPRQDYWDARRRAEGVLKQHGVTIPSIEDGSREAPADTTPPSGGPERAR